MIVPPLKPVLDGQILTKDLINHIIKRTEYGAELLRQYKSVAGNNIFVEQGGDGLVISYLNAVAGGAGTGSGGQGIGQGGQGIGQGGAGIGAGGAGIITPPISGLGPIPWNTRFSANGTNTMNGIPQLYPVEFVGWEYVNAPYAVWVNPEQDPLVGQPQTIFRTVQFPESGNYIFRFSADNRLSISVGNQFIGSIINEQEGFLNEKFVVANVSSGNKSVKFVAENTIGGSTWLTNPAGYSVEITKKYNFPVRFVSVIDEDDNASPQDLIDARDEFIAKYGSNAYIWVLIPNANKDNIQLNVFDKAVPVIVSRDEGRDDNITDWLSLIGNPSGTVSLRIDNSGSMSLGTVIKSSTLFQSKVSCDFQPMSPTENWIACHL